MFVFYGGRYRYENVSVYVTLHLNSRRSVQTGDTIIPHIPLELYRSQDSNGTFSIIIEPYLMERQMFECHDDKFLHIIRHDTETSIALLNMVLR